jgi:hypothetical protein
MLAILECGHTKEVPDCCTIGGVTSCDDCEPPDDAPGINRRIVNILIERNEP